MTDRVFSVNPSSPVADALDELIQRNVSGLPVLDERGHIVGVVSEKDMLQLFYEDRATVSEIMTREPVAVAVDEPLHEIIDIMMTNDFRRVLVHDGTGKLVGLVSRRDVMPAVLEALRARRAPR